MESTNNSNNCAICLERINTTNNNNTDQQSTRKLPVCNHEFHTTCIETWFNFAQTCPVCRHYYGTGSDNDGDNNNYNNYYNYYYNDDTTPQLRRRIITLLAEITDDRFENINLTRQLQRPSNQQLLDEFSQTSSPYTGIRLVFSLLLGILFEYVLFAD